MKIRPAREGDIPRMVEVEVSAGQAFHSVNMPEVAHDVPDPAALARFVAAQRAWVAEQHLTVVAFILGEALDGNTHIGQVAVVADYAGQRIGQALLEFVEEWGRAAGHPATTLTTFRDVPWNAPYYARLGYRELSKTDIGPELAAQITWESGQPEIDPSRRCAMLKPNPPSIGDSP